MAVQRNVEIHQIAPLFGLAFDTTLMFLIDLAPELVFGGEICVKKYQGGCAQTVGKLVRVLRNTRFSVVTHEGLVDFDSATSLTPETVDVGPVCHISFVCLPSWLNHVAVAPIARPASMLPVQNPVLLAA